MKSQYFDILERHDDPIRWENSKDFDYEKEQLAFFGAKDRLQHILRAKLQCETGSSIQDASYHSAIILDKINLKFESDFSQIRFSNFGKMVSIINEDCVLENIKIDIIQHLSDLGYTYIPENILSEQYTGKNKGVTRIDTWWVRYFDFV